MNQETITTAIMREARKNLVTVMRKVMATGGEDDSGGNDDEESEG